MAFINCYTDLSREGKENTVRCMLDEPVAARAIKLGLRFAAPHEHVDENAAGVWARGNT